MKNKLFYVAVVTILAVSCYNDVDRDVAPRTLSEVEEESPNPLGELTDSLDLYPTYEGDDEHV